MQYFEESLVELIAQHYQNRAALAVYVKNPNQRVRFNLQGVSTVIRSYLRDATLHEMRVWVENRMVKWLLKHGWVLMDDGTYHYKPEENGKLRVEFKENVVRIDVYKDWQSPSDRWPGDRWSRLFGAHYGRIRFNDLGVPQGLGFNSHPYLRSTWNDEKAQ